MRTSRSFCLLVRAVGVVGLCGGLLLVLIVIAVVITKASRMDSELIVIGAFMSAVSLYFVCGAPHLIRAVERHRDHDNNLG